MRHRLTLVAMLAIAASAPAAAQTLTPYDVFVFNDFRHMNSETNGRIAIGGNATLSNWRVGHKLPNGFSDFSLVVGGNLTSTEGSVAQGKTYVGGTYTGTNTGYPAAYPAPIVGGPSPVDFMGEMLRLTAISDAYAAMVANGTTQNVNGELNFIGNSNFNVFNVTISELQFGTAGYQFVTPVGATNIINVDGTSLQSAFNNTAFFFNCLAVAQSNTCETGSNENTPAAASLTLFNFNGQQSVVFGGPVHGSILAPRASVSFGYGDVVGTVVVNNAEGTAEFYDATDFVGPTVTATPEPATMGLVALGLLGIGAVRRRKKSAC